MEVLLEKSGGQTTKYLAVRTVDGVFDYKGLSQKNISGIKELLFCTFWEMFGAEILSEGKGQ